MSDGYVRQLGRVQNEYRAAGAALKFASEGWNRPEVIRHFDGGMGIAHRDVRDTLANLEATYFVRLFARFEGILEAHILGNHPRIAIGRDRKADWLVGRVARANRVRVDVMWRRRFDNVRRTRNAIAHGQNMVPVTFDQALSVLAHFLRALPERRR